MSGVRYRLAMPDPHTHLLEVEVRVGPVSGPVELVMPSWTPGSYLLREFARHVQEFRVSDAAGEPLIWRKTDKSTWRVEATAGSHLMVSYRVYANELSVRTSHLDASHAYVNGASVFMFARGWEAAAAELEVAAPEGWRVATSLPRASGNPSPVIPASPVVPASPVIPAQAGIQALATGTLVPRLRGDDGNSGDDGHAADDAESPTGAAAHAGLLPHAPAGRKLHRFRARDYDELVDAPLEMGTHRVLAWEQEGVQHEYAIWGRGEYDAERIVDDTRRVIDAGREMFGGRLPYERFVFILHLVPEGRGGLEHASSCSLQVSASKPLRGAEYESLIALVAHEYFHVWNAKRIRPEPLGPFDYTRENYTRNLWVVEGITTYYTDLLLVRAGLMSAERYLERLGESISRLQSLPGRHHQTLEDSSFDAWIRFYRPDEHTPNSQISYYHKGALVALLLDMEIRRATAGERSLDDVMRLLWERYGAQDVGFPEDPERGIQPVAEEVAGVDLAGFFERYVRGTDELDYAGALAVVGLDLAESHRASAPAAKELAELNPPMAEAEAAEQGDRANSIAQGGVADIRARPAADGARTERSMPGHPPGRGGTTWPTSQERTLGIRTQAKGDRLVITHVLAGGPAHAAGVNARDALVAVDGVMATQDGLATRLDAAAADEPVTLTLARRDVLLELRVTPGRVAERLRIVECGARDEATYHARAHWLRGAAAHREGPLLPAQHRP